MLKLTAVILWTFAISRFTNAQKLSFSTPMPAIFAPATDGNRTTQNKTRLTIPGVINYGGPFYALGSMCGQGIQIAVDTINKASLLDQFEVVVEPHDDWCMENLGIKMVMDLLEKQNETSENRLPVFLGPICPGHAWTGAFIQFYDHVGITSIAAIQSIYVDRQLYNSFFSLTPYAGIFYIALPYFIKSNGWSKVYLLSETLDLWNDMEQSLLTGLEKLNITLAGTSKIVSVAGAVPLPEHFETAIKDLKAFDPRIVVVNTNFGSLVACLLYKYKLYGPDYVFITFAGSYFLPNTPVRFLDCTDDMLFEVLQGWFFHYFGAPVKSQGERVDSLGMSASRLENELMDSIDRPELTSFWFHGRFNCYDVTVAAAVALDSVEKQLQRSNDSLINWVTKSANFQTNGTYISNLLKKSFENLQYQGLISRSSKPVNGLTGVTGFYQMQLVRQPSVSVSLSQAIVAVQIATYDSSDPTATVKFIAKQIWRTADGNPPYDSIRILPIKDPIISFTANAIVKAFAALLASTSIAILIFVLYRKCFNSEAAERSKARLDAMILLGNIFACCFVLILPGDGNLSVNISCMMASLSLAFGFYLLTAALLVKLQIAILVLQKTTELQPPRRPRNVASLRLPAASSNSNFVAVTNSSQGSSIPKENFTLEEAATYSEFVANISKYALFVPPAIAITQTVFMAIWFGIENIRVSKFNRHLEQPTSTDLSLVYRHFTMACSLDIELRINLGFVAYFIATFGVIFFRSASFAILLSKATIKGFDDLHLVRTASYSTGISAFAGGAVIWLFFRTDPGPVTLGCSVLVEIIVAIEIAVLFIAKVRSLITVSSIT